MNYSKLVLIVAAVLSIITLWLNGSPETYTSNYTTHLNTVVTIERIDGITTIAKYLFCMLLVWPPAIALYHALKGGETR